MPLQVTGEQALVRSEITTVAEVKGTEWEATCDSRHSESNRKFQVSILSVSPTDTVPLSEHFPFVLQDTNVFGSLSTSLTAPLLIVYLLILNKETLYSSDLVPPARTRLQGNPPAPPLCALQM